MVTKFSNLAALKKQPVSSGVKGFPIPMGKQMLQGPRKRKVTFPSPAKPKGK